MSAHADHEAYLRAALHAAADSLEPRGDGLERIRARLRQPRPSHARARAAFADVVMSSPAWLQDIVYQVAGWVRLACERFAPAQAPGRHRSRTQGLLRPLAAMAVVIFIVAAGTYVAIDAGSTIFPSSSNSQPGGGPKIGGHSGATAPHATHSETRSALGSGKSSPGPSPACKSTSPATRRPASGAASQQSTSTSPAPSTTPGPSATPADSSTSGTTSAAATPQGDTTSTTSPAPSTSTSVSPVNAPTTTPAATPALTETSSPAC